MQPADFDPNAEAVYDGIFGLPTEPDEATVVLIPVPFDATTSYRRGAAAGPEAILHASWQVDLHDIETGDPWRAGIAMLPTSPEVVAWNQQARDAADRARANHHDAASTARVNELSARLTQWVTDQTSEVWRDDRIVGIVGGDHACPLGAIEIAARREPGLGVLHIDAHADLRDSFEGFDQSHASIMHNVLARCPDIAKLVQVGVRDLCAAEIDTIERAHGKIRTFFDASVATRLLDGESFGSVVREILAELPDRVWISFDIDGLDPSLCPSTGTPVPGGLTFQQACYLLGALVRSGRRVVGFDLCEVAGPPEGDGIDGIVGARVLYKLVGWSLVSWGR